MKHPESVAQVQALNLTPVVIGQLVEELPELGTVFTCGWCGACQDIPADYRGMWVVCDSCGGV